MYRFISPYTTYSAERIYFPGVTMRVNYALQWQENHWSLGGHSDGGRSGVASWLVLYCQRREFERNEQGWIPNRYCHGWGVTSEQTIRYPSMCPAMTHCWECHVWQTSERSTPIETECSQVEQTRI